ncbi:MAG: hypothetical protein M3313_15890, partial [Actinomycetota bacterium]|nr:hypothetical protein [Actinomycetota bacterium]
MAIKKLMSAGAIVAGLAGTGLVGALVSTTSISYAEEVIDEAASNEDAGRPRGPGESARGPGGPPPLDVAADALGISEDELRTELEA